MDYSLVVGIDQENQELVVGMIGKLRSGPVLACTRLTHVPPRFHSHIYLGQEAGELGQGICIPRRQRQGAYDRVT